MKTAYLIYRPVMDYEESLTPYLICESKDKAQKAVERIRDYMDELMKKLPAYPDADEENPSFNKAWDKADLIKREILANARWPFGINLVNEIQYGSNTWDRNSVESMPLPLIS